MIELEEFTIFELQDLSNEVAVNHLVHGIESITDFRRDNKDIYDINLKDKPGNLFRVLDEGRYKNGCYYVVLDKKDNSFVLSTGWNKYTDDIALLATRSITHPNYRYRTLINRYFVPMMVQKAISQNFSKLWIVFNDYNKGLYDWAVNERNVRRKHLNSSMRDFVPIGQQEVYYTKQWTLEYRGPLLTK